MIDWLTVAPASISLFGQILTFGCRMAPSPIVVPSVADYRALEDHHLALDRALAAYDRTADLCTLADVGVAPDYRSVHRRARVDDRVVTDHARTVNDDTVLDLGGLAEEHRAVQLGVAGDLDVVGIDVDTAADVTTDRLQVDLCLRVGRDWRAGTPEYCRRRTSTRPRRTRRARPSRPAAWERRPY